MANNRGAFSGANVTNTQGDVFAGHKIVSGDRSLRNSGTLVTATVTDDSNSDSVSGNDDTGTRRKVGGGCVDLKEFVNDPVHKSVGLSLWLMSQGIALVVAGVYVLHLLDEVAAIVGSEYDALCIWIISGGVLIFIVAAIGIIGACRGVFWLVTIFSGLSVVIFVSELSSGIWGFLLQDQVQQTVFDRLNQSMKRIDASDVREGWEYIHQNFQCCGVVNHKDWDGILSEPPESCCKITDSDKCSKRTFNYTSPIYTKSCKGVAIRWMRHCTIVVSVVAVCSAFFQIFGIISSVCLALVIKDKGKDSEHRANASQQNETAT